MPVTKSRLPGRWHCWSVWLSYLYLLAGTSLQGELALTNFSAANPLKVMAVGDSITDDCSLNGAWRQYLQPLLETNGYPFTFLGRFSSPSSGAFTKVKHEGICGAVIAAPGLMTSPVHNYAGPDTYLQKTLMDGLATNAPDLVLIMMGANDIGRGRNPYLVATNHLPALLDSIFAKLPSANIIVTKPTTLQNANVGAPLYSSFATNIHIYNTAMQSMINARRAQGQNVFLADMFSVVDGRTMFLSDNLHPNAAGLNAIANEWLFRIDAITARTNRVVTPLIAGGSVWRYSDWGQDLGTNWAQPHYDDSAWAQGPARLGYNIPGVATTVNYGPISTNKYITTYFRHSFVVPSDVHYTNLNFRLNRAHGAVVWLNGREVIRANMPSGPISFLNYAKAALGLDALHIYYPTNIPVSFMPTGTNVVAVEIHTYASSAPGISFDLELFGMGDYPPPAPPLSASLNGEDVRLRWPATNNAGFILITGTDLSGTYSWLPLGGPYILNGDCYEYSELLNLAHVADYYQLRYVGLPANGPQLGLRLESNVVVSSWAGDVAGFNLEASSGLERSAVWETVNGPYSLSNGSFKVWTARIGVSNQFFRLRKPLRYSKRTVAVGKTHAAAPASQPWTGQ
jgi:lysophospholipase L1-like esterase